ncbi:hypothetical protein F511_27247 [Dorcoceras hygrometricum]|uniref:Uncharacterized protein n=1 Tax=Dorcoceras hygrometricum TaxID=472368 RepID=A0A2Z7DC27_9LAMI|nr:hypothetical protein F511_27247 [Dorcoceras hygrometricum]
MFGLHFRVENRIWSISGKFEIFEILVKSSNRFDDVSVVGMRCDADVNIAGLRDLSVKSVSGFDDVSISWLLSVDDIWLRSVQRAFYGAAPFSERGRRDLFCLVGVRKFRPDDVSISVVFRATSIVTRLACPPPPLLEHAAAAAAADRRRKIVSGQFDEENPFVLISSALIVQPDEGVSDLVVDRIGDNLPQSTEKKPDYCNTGWSQAQVPARFEYRVKCPDARKDSMQRRLVKLGSVLA